MLGSQRVSFEMRFDCTPTRRCALLVNGPKWRNHAIFKAFQKKKVGDTPPRLAPISLVIEAQMAPRA